MRILGIDFGTKRIGLAISDELGCTAQPLAAVRAGSWQEIAALVRARGVSRIVVGLPRNMDGSEGPAVAAVRQFIASLQSEVDVPVETWDERLTSVQAQRVLLAGNVSRQRRKQRVDSMAAQLLLQSWLDAHPPAESVP